MPNEKNNINDRLIKQRERELAETLTIIDERFEPDLSGWFDLDLSRLERETFIVEIRKEAKRRCQ